MKRDLKLIKDILHWAITDETALRSKNPEFESHTAEEISYHVCLMHEAGLVDSVNIGTIHVSRKKCLITDVTNAGHEFYELSMNDVLWKKALIFIGKEGASFTLQSVLAWLKQQAGII